MYKDFQVGKVYEREGKIIYITGISYISSLKVNQYSGREVKKNGQLGKEWRGYIGRGIPVDCDIKIKVIPKTLVSAVKIEKDG